MAVNNDIQCLDKSNDESLIKQGWFLADLYRSRGDESVTYEKALSKAQKGMRPIGIRRVVKNKVIYFEIWNHWDSQNNLCKK